jgi:release factor glutamine methyltransferase
MTGHPASTTHAELIADAASRLAGISNSPRLDAEVLLRHAAGLDRTALFLALREIAPEDVRARFQELLARRLAGEPVAYVTGTREFMGLPFAVTADVLVPRPETELLVEWALGVLPRLNPPVRAVDVGAGSGAIAVSIARLSPVPIEVTAIEPSAGARGVSARNRDTLICAARRSGARVTIVDDNLLSREPGPFDLVLANLPYLTPAQIADNPDLAAEPRMALDGGPDGLDLIERLVAQLPERLAERFALGLELDPSQAATVADLLARTLPGSDVSIIRDYAGLDRHVVATQLEP